MKPVPGGQKYIIIMVLNLQVIFKSGEAILIYKIEAGILLLCFIAVVHSLRV